MWTHTRLMKKKYEFVDENGVFQKYWATGGTKANMGIGQGEVLTTPVQVVNMINIIALNWNNINSEYALILDVDHSFLHH